MTPLQNRKKTIKWFRCSYIYLKSIKPQSSLPILDITKQHIQGTNETQMYVSKYRNLWWHFKVLIGEKCILKVTIKPKICQKCSKLHYYFIIQPGSRFWIISQIILQVYYNNLSLSMWRQLATNMFCDNHQVCKFIDNTYIVMYLWYSPGPELRSKNVYGANRRTWSVSQVEI